MKSKSSLLVLALAIASASAWSCSKSDSSAPAADAKPAAPAAAAPAAASASAAASAAAKPTAAPRPAAAAPVASAVKAAAPVATSAPVASAAAKPSGPDARTDIKTAVPEAIRLLETKDYANFVKQFMPPSQLSQMPIPVDQLVAMMTADPGAAAQFQTMIDTLKRIQGLAPTMSADGNKATFTLDPPIANEKQVSLVKENGLWYLGD